MSAMWVFVLLLIAAAASGLTEDVARDVTLSTPELIAAYGYTVETHTVETEDGYILTMHRIPHGRVGSNVTTPRFPIFLQHGLLCTSSDWIITQPGKALGYILADAGYDVWMGNYRGNTYSKAHVRYSTESKEFWDFSWHENGKFDLPAMINYVLAVTNETKLYYVGHSMGTTGFYALMSLRPEYNNKIRAMVSLAPVAFMNHVTSPFLQSVAWTYRGDEWVLNALGLYEFVPNSELTKAAGELLCKEEAITEEICANVLFLMVGWNSQNLNRTQLPVFLAHTPAGASSKQMLHYSQEVVSGHFRQWDYGMISNVFHYGTPAPPDYDLSKITAPVILFYSDNDWMVNVVDVQRLYSSLPNAKALIHIEDKLFNHMDYLWGINSREQVYDNLVSMLSNY